MVYGFDVWKIDSYREVLRGQALIERLKNDPDSRWRAEKLGGEQHIGWTVESYLLAGLIDSVNTQSKGKKLKKSEMVERPKIHTVREFKPQSVAEMKFGVLFGES